jgi:hypothetical protein
MRTMSRQGFWNPWWTLTWIAAALTIAVALLEYLDAFGDLGVVLSMVGLMLTMLFGITASTRSSVAGFQADVIPALERIEHLLMERLPPR